MKTAELKELMKELLDYIDPPPDKNCSCFIWPPCSDCVDYSHLRELLEMAKTFIKSDALINFEEQGK